MTMIRSMRAVSFGTIILLIVLHVVFLLPGRCLAMKSADEMDELPVVIAGISKHDNGGRSLDNHFYMENMDEEASMRRRLVDSAPPSPYDTPRSTILSQEPMDLFAADIWSETYHAMRPVVHPEFDSVHFQMRQLSKRYWAGKRTQQDKEEDSSLSEEIPISKEQYEKEMQPLSNQYNEMLDAFNKEKANWDERTQQEITRQWKEMLRDDQDTRPDDYAHKLLHRQEQYRAYQRATEEFQKELESILATTTSQNQIAHPQQPLTRRHPNHDFAIYESRIIINWPLANFFLLFLEASSSESMLTVSKALVAETNIPGAIPTFVDSSWLGFDMVHGSCPKTRARVNALPDDERELIWTMTGYYKVYPPNDEYVEQEEDGYSLSRYGWGHSIPFSRASVHKFFQLIREDLKENDAQPWTRKDSVESIFTDDCQTGKSQAEVTSFRDLRGNRVEFWDYAELHDRYAILQTHQGRVVIVAVSGGHAYVFCNLLEFYNSDGSNDMPNLLGNKKATDAKTAAKLLMQSILNIAQDFMYKQMH